MLAVNEVWAFWGSCSIVGNERSTVVPRGSGWLAVGHS